MGPFTEAEAVNTSSTDWTPTKAAQTSAILCTSSGNLEVNMRGLVLGTPGSTDVVIPMTTGEVLELVAVKVVKASTTGSYIALYG
jgi:hypothetical protein